MIQNNFVCFKCKNTIFNHSNVYKGYDKNFCSNICRTYIIKNYEFNENYILIKKEKSIYKNVNKKPDRKCTSIYDNEIQSYISAFCEFTDISNNINKICKSFINIHYLNTSSFDRYLNSLIVL